MRDRTTAPWVSTGARWASAQIDRVLPAGDGVTALVYHRVGGGSASQVDLTADEFRRQLAHLREAHVVVPLDAAVCRLGDRAATGPCVVVTFDDGTADFCDVVLPLLAEFDVPATVYVSTHFVDTGETFPWGAPPATWAGLRDAAASGFVTVGSHTHTHALGDRTAPAEFAAELDRSIELIGEHVGNAPSHFAYPKALPGRPEVEVLVRSRFVTAAIAGNRVNRPGRTDLHRLSRTPVKRSDGMEFFKRKAAGGMRLEGELRELVAKVKYRGAGN